MTSPDLTAIVEGSAVRVLRSGTAVGSCRFSGEHLVDYQGEPLGPTESAHETALSLLAERLLADARAELAAMNEAAHDEQGVDVSLIRWMLSLTPLERLQQLEAQSRFVFMGRAALRSSGVAVPEGAE